MFTMSSNHVRDKVAFVEGAERLVLTVDVDPLGIIDEMTGIIGELKNLDEKTADDKEFLRLARKMGVFMFGEEQTEQLVTFYHGNPKQLFSMITRYFVERLNGLVVAKQKKIGKKRRFGK